MPAVYSGWSVSVRQLVVGRQEGGDYRDGAVESGQRAANEVLAAL
jgi:hypothetical protein